MSSIHNLYYFQSHFGLISTNSLSFNTSQNFWLSIPFWSDFNIIDSNGNGYGICLFQSHFGLISTVCFLGGCDDRSFQSHFGLISTCIKTIHKTPTASLSIPFWSDFNESKMDIQSGNRRLSIPFWSDFNAGNGWPIVLMKLVFQSHFGLISTSYFPLSFCYI